MRRTFGTANSLASHDRNRMSMSFESIGGARLRISKHAKLVERGSKKRKNHVGQLQSFEFDIDSCIENVFDVLYFREL